MLSYVINENVSPAHLELLRGAVGGLTEIRAWPDGSAALPPGIDVAILIIQNESSELEEIRVLTAINARVRIVCVHIEPVEKTSPLSQKYCSAKVSLASGLLGEALKGNDNVQQGHDGQPAPRNPQRPHRC